MKCEACGEHDAIPRTPICAGCAAVLLGTIAEPCECPTCTFRRVWTVMYPTVEALTC